MTGPANSSRMTNTTNPQDLCKRIEQLVEEYISAMAQWGNSGFE